MVSLGQLVLAATPIGNTGDASQRLRDLLATADLVAAEDTRKARDLARRLGIQITGRVVSCFEHNEAERADELLDLVAEGGVVVLITDAGMPGVSDPGYRLVSRAITRELPVTTAPGPSAVLAALAISGLPSDRFTFEGFLPRRAAERDRYLAGLAGQVRTMVFFESPHRIVASLDALAREFGPDRPAAICRELTKTHEEVLRGSLGTLAIQVSQRSASQNPLRGEIAIVVAGAGPAAPPDREQLVAAVRGRIAAGERLKDACAAVAEQHQVSRRQLYNDCLSDR